MGKKIFITLGSQKFQFNRLLKAVDELCERGTIEAADVFAQIGYLSLIHIYVTADGIPLGRWLSNQTNSHSMTDEQLKRLQRCV